MVEELVVKKMNILNKVFLTTNDISVLLDCSIPKASDYRKQFLKKQNMSTDYFKALVPVGDFVKYFKIDINIIRDNYLLVKKGEKNARVN